MMSLPFALSAFRPAMMLSGSSYRSEIRTMTPRRVRYSARKRSGLRNSVCVAGLNPIDFRKNRQHLAAPPAWRNVGADFRIESQQADAIPLVMGEITSDDAARIRA